MHAASMIGPDGVYKARLIVHVYIVVHAELGVVIVERACVLAKSEAQTCVAYIFVLESLQCWQDIRSYFRCDDSLTTKHCYMSHAAPKVDFNEVFIDR